MPSDEMKELMAQDVANIQGLAEMTEELIYTAPGQPGQPLQGVVEEQPSLDQAPSAMPNQFDGNLGSWVRVYLPMSEVSERPPYGAKVQRPNQPAWRIQQVMPDGAWWSCWASSNERIGR